jgi:aminomethyltransferase
MRLDALTRDYGDIDAEVVACRNDAALFDFSFMSRGVAAGPRARARVQALIARPLDTLRPGRIVYGLRTDDRGHVLADLTVWQTGADRYEVFSGRAEDIAALGADDLTAESCVLSLQGPGSLRALAGLAALDVLSQVGYFGHCRLEIAGVACQVGRLGYTGERGFEFIAPAAAKQRLWEALSMRARPAGFAAADILRIEAGFALFCNEFRPMVTPAEAGLQRFGEPLAGPSPRATLVGFTATCRERPILHQPGGTPAFPPEQGTILVTSAAWSAASGCTIGLGYVRPGATQQAPADPSGTCENIRLARVPFVDPEKRRVRGGWRAGDLLPQI